MPSQKPIVILASSSPWRRRLLCQLGVRFTAKAPDVDESRRDGEAADALTERLARMKAQKIAEIWPRAIVIGADQVAEVNGAIVGKPGTKARAKAQLRAQSGQRVAFYTGLCVSAPKFAAPLTTVETVITRFRDLSDAEIERYVAAEDVTATAGSIKSEGLGITLVDAIESRDPGALVGLPLIALRRFLAAAGMALP